MQRLTFTCPVCQWDKCYEDEEGGIVCAACGSQSQDYVNESFDVDEGMQATKVGGRLRTLHQKDVGKKERLLAAKKTAVDPECEDFLTAYQFCLKLFAECAEAAIAAEVGASPASTSSSSSSGSSLPPSLTAIVRQLWFNYLHAWARSGRRIAESFAYKKTKDYEGKDDARTGAPPRPTKALLLGFLCLALRLQKSWVVTADLVRWCQNGVLPYTNLWAQLPLPLRQAIDTRSYAAANTVIGGNRSGRWVYVHQRRGGSIAPSEVLFQAAALHACLPSPSPGSPPPSPRDCFPPLNAPLVAWAMVARLGLPLEVWSTFTELTHILRAAEPLPLFRCWHQHQAEHVMAMVVVAARLTPRWVEWSLARVPDAPSSSGSSSSGGGGGGRGPAAAATAAASLCPPVASLADVDTLPRAHLPALLAQMRRTLPDAHASARGYVPETYVPRGDPTNVKHQAAAAVASGPAAAAAAAAAVAVSDPSRAVTFNRAIAALWAGVPTASDDADAPITAAAATALASQPAAASSGPSFAHTVAFATALALPPVTLVGQLHLRAVQKPAATDPAAYAAVRATQRVAAVVGVGSTVTRLKPRPARKASDAAAADVGVGVDECSGRDAGAKAGAGAGVGRALRRLYRLQGSDDPVAAARPVEGRRRRLITYCRHAATDPVGVPHAAYIALVERAARYLLIPPGLLHALVDQVDLQVMALALDPPTDTTTVTVADTTTDGDEETEEGSGEAGVHRQQYYDDVAAGWGRPPPKHPWRQGQRPPAVDGTGPAAERAMVRLLKGRERGLLRGLKTKMGKKRALKVVKREKKAAAAAPLKVEVSEGGKEKEKDEGKEGGDAKEDGKEKDEKEKEEEKEEEKDEEKVVGKKRKRVRAFAKAHVARTERRLAAAGPEGGFMGNTAARLHAAVMLPLLRDLGASGVLEGLRPGGGAVGGAAVTEEEEDDEEDEREDEREDDEEADEEEDDEPVASPLPPSPPPALRKGKKRRRQGPGSDRERDRRVSFGPDVA